MIEDIDRLLHQYALWLKDRTSLRQVSDWVEITTPYLDRHNDHLQIYVRRDNNGYLLTDDGYVLDDLEQSGCPLDSPKRQQLLRMTLSGFGVKLSGKALEAHASPDSFAMRKHNLVQAMLAVNDMFYLAAPAVTSLFYEDVAQWLDLHEIRHTPRVKFTGKSGYDHLFDFVIPKSRHQPERIVQAINRPNRDTAQSLIWSWIDTKEVRPPDSRAYGLLNDAERVVQPVVLEALRSYEVIPVLWTEREKIKMDLVA